MVHIPFNVRFQRTQLVPHLGTRTTKVSSVKWVMKKKSMKVTKLIYVARTGGLDDEKAATLTRTRALRDNLVGIAVLILEDTETSRKPRSFESESSDRCK